MAMRSFNFFTHSTAVEGIFQAKQILRGTIISNQNSLRLVNTAISLTTSNSSVGHGLPDGQDISNHPNRNNLNRHIVGGKEFCLDHTEFKLTLEIDTTDINLKKCTDYYAKNIQVLSALEIKGHYPLEAELTTKQINLAKEKFQSGELCGMGNTWWYYFSEIPFDWIKSVAIKHEDRYVDTPLDAISKVFF